MPKQSLIADREILESALIGLQSELVRVDAAMSDIRARLGQRGPGRPAASTDGAQPAKRRMSAAARKRIGEATRRRWAAFRQSKAEQKAPAGKPKRKMSRAGRAAIIAATKKRWAEFRKQKAAAAKRTVKKTAPKAKARKAASKVRKTRVLAAMTPMAGVPAPGIG